MILEAWFSLVGQIPVNNIPGDQFPRQEEILTKQSVPGLGTYIIHN
jgi:hypothetical protein